MQTFQPKSVRDMPRLGDQGHDPAPMLKVSIVSPFIARSPYGFCTRMIPPRMPDRSRSIA